MDVTARLVRRLQTLKMKIALIPDFPLVTVRDWVKTQTMLADRLGVNVWYAIIGGSLGGMHYNGQWTILIV